MGLLQGPAQRDQATVKKCSFRIHQRKLLSKSGRKAIYTGAVGDGKIFVYDVNNAIRVRIGEAGVSAVSSEPE